MNIAIVGSREYPELEDVIDWCEDHVSPTFDIILSGGARGVDQKAKYWAQTHEVGYREFPADWETFGKSAGYKRNAVIVSNADRVVVFWDGKSKGSRHVIDLTLKVAKPLEVITPNQVDW